MKISDKLKYYRKQNNLTQKELADKLHLSRKTISAWENGRGYPDINSITQLSDIFGVSTDDLLRDNNLLEHYSEQNKQNQRARRVTMFCYFINMFLAFMCYGHIFDFIDISSSTFLILLFVNTILFFSNYTNWNSFRSRLKRVGVLTLFIVLLFINAIVIPSNTQFFELLKVHDQAEKLGVVSSEFIIIVLLSLSVTLLTCFYPHTRKRKRQATK